MCTSGQPASNQPRALPGHQSSNELVHQSKRLGHQGVQGIQDAHMRQVPNGTKFSKCASTSDADSIFLQGQVEVQVQVQVQEAQQTAVLHLPRRTVHTAEPQSARPRSASHCRARLQRCSSPSTAPTVHTTEWQSAGISTETYRKAISHVTPLHTHITYGHTSRTGDGRPLQGQ